VNVATPFVVPTYDGWAMFYTAIGAAIFWGKWGRTRLRPFLLAPIMDFCFRNKKHEKARVLIEFMIFIALGVLIGVGFAEPSNIQQAIAAGLGWTGLLTSDKH
jgi:hypothetical protein